MNRIYKVIWNIMTQSLVVVSELAKGRSKLSSTLHKHLHSTETQFNFKLTILSSLFFITLPSQAYIDIQQTVNGSIQNGQIDNNQVDSDYKDKIGSRPYNYWNPGNRSYTDKGRKNIDPQGLNEKQSVENYFDPKTAQGIKLGRETDIKSTADKANPQYDGIAIGDYSKATGGVAVALGAFAQAEKTGSVAVGTAARAHGFNSLSMMRQSAAIGDYSTAIGSVAWAKGNASFALGASATALGDQSIAIGSVLPKTLNGENQNGARKTKYDGMNRTQTNGHHSIAIGSAAKTNGRNSLAFGSNAETGQFNKVKDTYLNANVMKADPNNKAEGAIAFGVESKAKKEKTIAFGYQAEAHGKKAVAIGTGAKATQDRATVLGTSAQSKAKNATALGFAAQAKHKNSVALGASSVTTEKVATEKTTINGNEHKFAGEKPIGTVSIGSTNQERTLTNLAAGRISDKSTDAINGSQLYALQQEVEKGWMLKVEEAGGKVVNANGASKVKLGDTVTIKAGKNIKIKQDGANVTIATRDNLTVNKLIAGGKNGQKSVDGVVSAKGKDGKSGVTLKGKEGAIEIASPNNTNGSITKVTVSVAKGSKGLKGQEGAHKARLVYTRPNDQQEEVATLNDGLMFVGNDGNDNNKVVKRKLNQKLGILGGIADSSKLSDSTFVTSANLGVRYKDDHSLEIVMKRRPKFAGIVLNGKDGKDAEIKFKNKDGQEGMSIVGKPGSNGEQNLVLRGPDDKDGVTFNQDGRITNLMDGKDSKDAVNLGQLEKAKEELTEKGFAIQAEDGNAVKKRLGEKVDIVGADSNIKTKVEDGKVKIALAKQIDLSEEGSLKTGSTKVSNDGVKVGDTVELNQQGLRAGDIHVTSQGINAGHKQISHVASGLVDNHGQPVDVRQASGNTLYNAVNVGDLKHVTNALHHKIDKVNSRVNRLDKQVRGVGANSAAAASLPQVYRAGKSMLSAAAGGYSGASALAVGYSRASDNGKLILKLTGTANSVGQYSGGVGLGYQW
ncbi:MAG: YadA-like family protein [Pasteurella oralis]|uniref:YadA-like family protein n=1 Tax=Pasteurella oralis TaxID=1071947 RepID=UPI0026FAE73F|nr:YadA-like family protein [Pasteurella oralis]